MGCLSKWAKSGLPSLCLSFSVCFPGGIYSSNLHPQRVTSTIILFLFSHTLLSGRSGKTGLRSVSIPRDIPFPVRSELKPNPWGEGYCTAVRWAGGASWVERALLLWKDLCILQGPCFSIYALSLSRENLVHWCMPMYCTWQHLTPFQMSSLNWLMGFLTCLRSKPLVTGFYVHFSEMVFLDQVILNASLNTARK